MANNGNVKLVFKPLSESEQQFPIIDVKDVRVDNNTRLDGVLVGLQGNFVRCDIEQDLTDTQKELARNNIGAAKDGGDNALKTRILALEQSRVSYSTDQSSMGEESKARARNNIGAASASSLRTDLYGASP